MQMSAVQANKDVMRHAQPSSQVLQNLIEIQSGVQDFKMCLQWGNSISLSDLESNIYATIIKAKRMLSHLKR